MSQKAPGQNALSAPVPSRVSTGANFPLRLWSQRLCTRAIHGRQLISIARKGHIRSSAIMSAVVGSTRTQFDVHAFLVGGPDVSVWNNSPPIITFMLLSRRAIKTRVYILRGR